MYKKIVKIMSVVIWATCISMFVSVNVSEAMELPEEQILIDGTQLYKDTKRLDERCLTKTHRNKEDGSIRYI